MTNNNWNRKISTSKGFRDYLKIVPYVLVCLLPIMILIVSGLNDHIGSPKTLGSYYNQRTFVLLLKTIFYGLSVSIILSIIGFIGALGLLCIKYSRRTWVIGLLVMMVPIPATIIGLMWMEVFSWLASHGFETMQTGWGVTVIVQVMYLLPISVLICYSVMIRVPQTEIEVAKILKPNWQVFLKIWIPLCKHGILIVGMVTFFLTINDYSIPAAYAVTIYPMEVFARYSISLEASDALMSSLPLFIIGLCIVFPIASIIKSFYMNTSTKSKVSFINEITFIKQTLSKIVISVLLIVTIVPIVVLISKMDVTTSGLFAGGFREIVFTFMICLLAGVIALPIMWLCSEFLYKHKSYLGLVLMPAVFSPALIGAGLIKMWNHSLTEFIYLSPVMPILAVMIRFMPFGILVMLASKTKNVQDLITVGHMKSKDKTNVFYRITLPIMVPTLMLASGLVFLFGLGELGTTIMVLPPGLSTITVKIFGYLHYGASEQISTMSIWVMVIIFSFTLLGNFVYRKGGNDD